MKPYWWLYALAAVGWLALAAAPGSHLHGGMAEGGLAAWASLGEHAALSIAMVAVMTPLIAGNVRYAALRSPRRARFGVTLAVTAGWVSIWLVPAVGIAMASWLAMVALGTVASIALVTILAVGWQWSEAKRLSLTRCHRVFAPPLSPGRGRAASRCYGRDIGRSCVVSCVPFMALMAVSGHSVVVAVPVAGIAWYERWRRPHHDPARGLTSAAVAAVGVEAAAIAALGLG